MTFLSSENWDKLYYPEVRKSTMSLCDIQDGAEFKRRERKLGTLICGPESLGFILFPDGVPLWKSSGQSLWPVYLAVSNLPPHLRMQKENLILNAVWVGESKLKMQQLLSPTITMLKKLERGVTINTSAGVKNVRGILLCAIFD